MIELVDQIGPRTQKFLIDLIRGVVREEIHQEIPGIVREQTADIKRQTVRLEQDVSIVRSVQGQQNITLRATQSTVASLKNNVRQQTKEMSRINILLEDLNYRFEAGSELI